MKIPEVRYIKFQSTRNFGIELEMNNRLHPKQLAETVMLADPSHQVLQSNHYEQDYNNKYWHIKFDRSCGDIKNVGGWEVASYKASGYKDLTKMGKIADALKKAGATVNNDCGLHIHVEIADFTIEHAANLVALWMKIESIICEMLPKHRRNNKYCKLMVRRFPGDFFKVYTPQEFWEIVKPQRYDNPNRRVALNMCNYAEGLGRKTTELRLPDCVLDGKEVKNWIRFFVNFVEQAKVREFPGTVEPVGLHESLRILGLHGDNPFLILSKGLRETKIWFMRRILLHSTRRKIREDAETILNLLESHD